MKILFLDHAFHKETRSSNFFLSLITDNFDLVDVEYIDSEKLYDISGRALAGKRVHDLVILWQLDYLAPIFLASGYRTLVVPMYDGSANMPYEHWIGMSGASFVNFSRTLHERIIAIGGRSFLSKYYLPPVKEEQLPKFKDLRGILWMRHPQEGLTPNLIQRIFGKQISSLHVHNAPDNGESHPLNDHQYGAIEFQITESRWSCCSNVYIDALARCNIFFAPRMSEGIGMTMLEAFSRGLLVIANDDAVHNEYVANWVNGILFNRDNTANVHLSHDIARDLAFCGWCGAVSGYQEWLDTKKELVDFIRNTPESIPLNGSISQAYASALWDAYKLGGSLYRHFLQEHVVDWNNREVMLKVVRPIRELVMFDKQDMPKLDKDALFFGTSPKSVGRKFGFKEFDAFSANLGNETIGFSVQISDDEDNTRDFYILLECNLLQKVHDDWTILTYVNRNLYTHISMKNTPGDFNIKIPLGKIQERNLDVMLTFLNSGSGDRAINFPKIKFNSVRLENPIT